VKTIAIYPGSFDPITLGHLSILNRAAALFDEVHLMVVHNPNKKVLFSISERVSLCNKALVEVQAASNILVAELSSGLLVEKAQELGAQAFIKGFRTSADIEYELPMAQVNRDLSSVETIFLPAEPGYGYVSSSLVKEVLALNGDVSGYVTPNVASALKEKLQ